jgi:CheY-like chemotaxis protein
MTRLLAVDDEPINLAIISECLSDEGYQIDQAEDGEAAWTLMQHTQYDLILLDRMMPKLDGLSLLRRAKADPRWTNVPVIMQTAAAKQEDVRDGLEAGAYYYLTKPYEPEALRILVSTVLADLTERDKLHEAGTHLQLMFGLLEQGSFVFRTLDEARGMAAALANLCQDASGSSMGLAELLVNAIEHGNLGITYKEKAELRQNYQWENEVARRLDAEPWCHLRARIGVRRVGDEIEFIITDQGKGFDWKPFLDFDPERAFDLNGRGIAMARMMGFATLEYQGAGNVVVARTKAA